MDVNEKQIVLISTYILSFILIIMVLFELSLANFLFFHVIVEMASLVVSFTIFIIAFHSRKYLHNSYLLFMAPSFLITGIIDFFHTLTYKGMDIFVIKDANIPTQLWIASRYIQVITFFIVSFIIYFSFKTPDYIQRIWEIFLIGYLIAVLYSIFIWENFPTCYVEGVGLTQFKVFSESIFALLFLIALCIILLSNNQLDKLIKIYLIIFFILSISIEVFFSIYVDVYGLSNIIGHILKLLSTFAIYIAFIEVGLARPQKIIFTNMQRNAESLKQEIDLLNQFTATMSHEIKNPMKVIKLCTYNMQKEFESLSNEDIQMYLTKIARSVVIVENNIDDLLLSTALDWRKISLNLEESSLDKIIKNSINEIDLLSKSKNITFKFDNINDKLINVDEKRMKQIFRILIENSIKYSNYGSTVTIMAKEEMIKSYFSKQSAFLNVSVIDTGIGIDKEDISKLFTKYFRANNAKDLPGTGLGLSIANNLVKLHHGKIIVSSEIGKGSTFTVQLPLKN